LLSQHAAGEKAGRVMNEKGGVHISAVAILCGVPPSPRCSAFNMFTIEIASNRP